MASSRANTSGWDSDSGPTCCAPCACRAGSFRNTRGTTSTASSRATACRPATATGALADADLIWQFWRLLQRDRGGDVLAEAVQQQLKRPSLLPHLDATMLDDLPESPGVYLLHGDNDVLLYVGKSVNLRQRVLSHFAADTREYKAMRLTQEVRRIHWHETVGELGALLLESRLVMNRPGFPSHFRAGCGLPE